MQSLQLLPAEPGTPRHEGEVGACCFSPDNRFVLSGGWDGHLRLWDVETGSQVHSLRASPKPLSACAIAPNGLRWYSGSLDGILAEWDAVTRRQTTAFLAHPRPVSAIVFAPGGRWMATAAWDCKLILWNRTRERDGHQLTGHEDIVAGCRFSGDGRTVLSWSNDGTARLWNVERQALMRTFGGHLDRVGAAALSPDGKWLLTASRSGAVRLWSLQGGASVGSVVLGAEARGCFCLLDGSSVGTVDAAGTIRLHALPDMRLTAELATGLPVQCAELAPSSGQVALGCADGQVRLIAIDGFDRSSLAVTATYSRRRTATRLQRFFGKSRIVDVYSCTCPACRESLELSETGQATPCPRCRRRLHVSSIIEAETAV